ncbi:hypothetical protein TNCV_3264861 [Trichonephila clavipes]|nr:hypothetical protein TNCV_3264861 [Trichonephila clavipes]
MVFQERMLHNEPTEARLEELLQSGKEYLPLAMHMADENTILNTELSSLATNFATSLDAGSALAENPSNLFVESYETSPVLPVQDSPFPNLILVRLWVRNLSKRCRKYVGCKTDPSH